MTLEQRIAQSAAELGKLLRQAEKQYQRFLKRRDAKMQSISPRAPWVPDGHPLVFLVQEPLCVDLVIDFRPISKAFDKAASVHGTQSYVPLDNGKPFKPIGLRRAKATHRLSTELTQQVHKAVEQIDSKLNAVLEIHGTEAVFQNPASKIVFNIEISRINGKFCNQVHYVIKAH